MRILAGSMDHIDNSDIPLNADKVKLSSTLQDILVHYAVAIGHRQCCTMCSLWLQEIFSWPIGSAKD